jgi:arylsulfatase A-like enzyme
MLRLLLSLLISLALLSPVAAEPASMKPNVVLILTDDMGYADLGCYGSPDIRTPHIDRLARQGVRLPQFYAAPVCTPSRAALMTGRWQQRVGLEWAIYPRQLEPGLPTSEITLPRLLKNAGYRTDMVGKWHLGYHKEFGPNAHGFDSFYGLLSGNVDHYSHKENTGDPDWYQDTKPLDEKGYSTDLLTARAVQLIEKNSKSPFFLYVAYNAVHWPFQAPGKPDDVRDRSTWYGGTRKDYAAMVERVDDGVGKILAALDKTGVADNTLVIFTNDNGGERLSDNGPLFHHKATLWEGGIRVPCILRWPGHLPAGKVSEQPAISMDLTATLVAACGATLPAGRTLDGIDLLPSLTGDRIVPRTFFWRIERADRKQRAVRQGNWKYVRDSGIELLFDLAADPGERKTLAYHHPEVVQNLRQKLAAWEKEMDEAKPAFRVR